MQEILSHLKILRVFSPWIINLSKSVEQKSGSKQNCPNGQIHSNRQTLFQLLTHSQRKAVQIFSASQNGIWETLLWTITRTSEWNQHKNGPLGVLDDYTKNINIYVSGTRGNRKNRRAGMSEPVAIFIMYTTLSLQNCNHKLEITSSSYSAAPFQSLSCLVRTYFPNCNNTGSIEDSTRLCCYVIVIRLL